MFTLENKLVLGKQTFAKLSLAFSLVVSSLGAYASGDPTRPLSLGGATTTSDSTVQEPNDLVLQSIISLSASALHQAQKPAQRKAIISGQLVSLGQQVAGYQVIDISERQVILQSEDKSQELVLFSHPVVTYK